MLIFLLERGLSFYPNDSRLIKFLHIACYKGKIKHVQKLLEYGVPQDSKASRSDERDYVFGSALHAAVKSGQSVVVQYLLECGADARSARLCSETLGRKLVPTTPIAAAFEWYTIGIPDGRTSSDFWNACEMLLSAGVDETDCRTLLKQSTKYTHIDMVRRLLDRGIRLPEIPLSENLDIIRLFLATETKLDASHFQRHAIEKANIVLMKFLVDMNGPALPMGDFGFIAFKLLRGKSLQDNMAMLRYLVTEYGLDVNSTFPAHPGANHKVNLLQRACEESQPTAVQLLLEQGADPKCPGLPDSALLHLKQSLRSRGLSVGRFAEMHMPIIRLLLHYTKDTQDLEVPILSKTRSSSPSLTEQKYRVSDQGMELQPKSFHDVTDGDLSEHIPRDEVLAAELSPWIEETLEDFRYEKLQGFSAIRLIELEPSASQQDPIRCKTVYTHLVRDQYYDMLSCEWTNTDPTIPLLLDGKTFQAPLNLWSALCSVRLSTGPRHLWTEAICINSKDVEENNQQVALLRDICQKAGQLLVWLGEAVENSHLLFDHMRSCKAKKQWNWDRYDRRSSEAFSKLCCRPWFFRVRSVQELALSSKKAIVICGQEQEELRSLTKSASSKRPENSYHPLHGVDGPSHVSRLLDLHDNPSIESLLLLIAFCTADDAREKIFSIIGLYENISIPIDYGADVVTVFQTFTQKVIEKNRDINVLHWLGTRARRNGLPSWVPDFGAPISCAVLPRVVGSACY